MSFSFSLKLELQLEPLELEPLEPQLISKKMKLKLKWLKWLKLLLEKRVRGKSRSFFTLLNVQARCP